MTKPKTREYKQRNKERALVQELRRDLRVHGVAPPFSPDQDPAEQAMALAQVIESTRLRFAADAEAVPEDERYYVTKGGVRLPHPAFEQAEKWTKLAFYTAARLTELGIAERTERRRSQLTESYVMYIEAVVAHLALSTEQRARLPDAIRAGAAVLERAQFEVVDSTATEEPRPRPNGFNPPPRLSG